MSRVLSCHGLNWWWMHMQGGSSKMQGLYQNRGQGKVVGP
jgi:hypothetical protein